VYGTCSILSIPGRKHVVETYIYRKSTYISREAKRRSLQVQYLDPTSSILTLLNNTSMTAIYNVKGKQFVKT
jgi:hypothetical protein